jgi:hypothetical protein
MGTGTFEQPDMNKDHDVVWNPLDGNMVNLLCSCSWTYDCVDDYKEVVKNRHLGSKGLYKLT